MASWRRHPQVAPNLVLDHLQPACAAAWAPLPVGLDPRLRAALSARPPGELYTHQAEAYARAAAGEHLVVATPTASGKSLCFNLPVLQRLAEDPDACALYLFPTKALCRDQEASLRHLMEQAKIGGGAITYDGDTPAAARQSARDAATLLMTNPDMLHAAVLPHHARWARLFSRLAFVVVDELHTLRGVFGSHVANVLRRLRRAAHFHGARPQFLFASATLANAQAHASRMLGEPVGCIDHSGAPRGARQLMVVNPPVVNAALGVRASAIKQAVALTCDLVAAGVPTLVFGQSRNSVEVLLKYLRDGLAGPSLPADSIVAYRGGYLPDLRRRIERGLRAGSLRCVVATSALELGVDIGSLDAVVCVGHPGTQAALWQRFGRGGRRGAASLALWVPTSAPLDQYWACRPQALLEAPIEEARIDPDNIEVLVQHIKCGAFELPFRAADGFGDLPATQVAEVLEFLRQHRVVHPVGEGRQTTYHWMSDTCPAHAVSLRRVGWDNVVIVERPQDKTLAEMDWRSAHTMLHTQAIYQHDAQPYQVELLDLENRKAYVRRVDPDYYTDALTHGHLTPLEPGERAELAAGVAIEHGEVSLVDKVVGFKKIKFHSHENVGYGEVNLPNLEMHTTAIWWTFTAAALAALPLTRAQAIDALRGLAHVLHTQASLGLMVDPRDLGRRVQDGGEAGGGLFDPKLFVYENIPGGVGLSARLFAARQAITQRTLECVADCPCQAGCPGCVGAPLGDTSSRPAQPGGRRAALRMLLRQLGLGHTSGGMSSAVGHL